MDKKEIFNYDNDTHYKKFILIWDKNSEFGFHF